MMKIFLGTLISISLYVIITSKPVEIRIAPESIELGGRQVVQCVPDKYRFEDSIYDIFSYTWTGPYGVIETAGDRIRVNEDTGDLKIYEFRISDIGVYKCSIKYWTRKCSVNVEKLVVATHFLEDPCQPGYFRGTKETTCIPCPRDNYNYEYGSLGCFQCPSGTYTNPGASTLNSCKIPSILEQLSPPVVIVAVGIALLIISLSVIIWKRKCCRCITLKAVKEGHMNDEDRKDPGEETKSNTFANDKEVKYNCNRTTETPSPKYECSSDLNIFSSKISEITTHQKSPPTPPPLPRIPSHINHYKKQQQTIQSSENYIHTSEKFPKVSSKCQNLIQNNSIKQGSKSVSGTSQQSISPPFINSSRPRCPRTYDHQSTYSDFYETNVQNNLDQPIFLSPHNVYPNSADNLHSQSHQNMLMNHKNTSPTSKKTEYLNSSRHRKTSNIITQVIRSPVEPLSKSQNHKHQTIKPQNKPLPYISEIPFIKLKKVPSHCRGDNKYKRNQLKKRPLNSELGDIFFEIASSESECSEDPPTYENSLASDLERCLGSEDNYGYHLTESEYQMQDNNSRASMIGRFSPLI